MSELLDTEKKSLMTVVYVGQKFPETIEKSIMLVGPTPRRPDVKSWRPMALHILGEQLGYDGVVFVPERENETFDRNYEDQIETEERMLNMADVIVCWIPRDMRDMPALTTNDEFGTWKHSGKVVFGAPKEAVHVRYQQYYADKLNIPSYYSLTDTLRAALKRLEAGGVRIGGERDVPLMIWNTPAFKQWYANLLKAGNRLDGAKVEWSFRVGKNKSIVFMWALHVNVFVASEKRNKVNEFVLGRPDTSSVVAYRFNALNPMRSEVVLVREFRSTVSNSRGFVYELPGGSSFKPGVSPEQLASDEFFEEVGVRIDPSRMRRHGSRQLVATVLSHHSHLFSVELTEAEMNELKGMVGEMHGNNVTDSEQTYVEVKTMDDIHEPGSGVDYSTIGMISSLYR